ncbi:Predicted metal-dependent enzyme [uncultured Ruminococcus sp.]|uniref:DUF1385 domain-containing protein n=1 Tax=Massiliimalia timonensis TaxID=1987501 RepID=UPI000822EA60|nr:DUF1385 domain-containing protein [Massiliimalia timonensis]SCH21107.1 Predicted metal-dependent enzyme [uncultured Ruminococcus sp.]SCH26549.1 Predicted metal-dependent enzyme [uncultured Clostridium sp.]
MPEKEKCSNYKTSIGGQALIEGVMMRGVRQTAMAVRKPDQSIDVEVWDNRAKPGSSRWKRIPFVRGIFNMIDSLLIGYRCLMKSAEVSGMELEEEEPSKFDLWLEKHFGDKLMKYVSWLSAILGVVLAVVLFMLLPTVVVWGLDKLFPVGVWKGLIEGVIKIVIFILYMYLVGKIPDMRRMFQYHGAEHKTIACYEAGEELTVENIKKHSRFHPRCGTSFLILVLILGILIFSVVTWSNPLIRTLLKLALLPVVIGIAYELIKLAGRYDNLFTKIISFPGLKLQHLTTNEPDGDQIEVAIASLKPVLPQTEGEDRW